LFSRRAKPVRTDILCGYNGEITALPRRCSDVNPESEIAEVRTILLAGRSQ